MAASATPQTWTVLDLLRWTSQHFAERGIETARLDAELLLAHVLDCDRLRLYVDHDKPIGEAERARFRELVRARAGERVPVSILLGRREFWSLPLAVTRDVLTPRPETETLVAAALDALPDREAEWAVLDVGTGSGAIALAIAHERPKARVTATDVSAAALAVARANAEALGLAERVRFLEGSLFAPVADALAAGEPFVLAFATPKFCATAQCGPTLDRLKPVAEAHPEVTFINVEPYELRYTDGQLQLADNQLTPVPAVEAYGLLSEPYIFVVDRAGIVRASFEAIFSSDEIEAAIDGLG
jgi:16S rRNA G966 N2-methylase RsmD